MSQPWIPTSAVIPTGMKWNARLTGGVLVWVGSGWVEKPVKVWTGSVWVIKPMRCWSGSSWNTSHQVS